MQLASSETQTSYFSLRYFVQQTAPSGDTTFVLWFPDNNAARGSQTVLVFDADEVAISARTSIPHELNVVAVGPTATTSALVTGVIRDGLADTGFVEFGVSDYTTASTVNGNGSRAGVAFSLIGVNGAGTDQTQTELAHERGIK